MNRFVKTRVSSIPHFTGNFHKCRNNNDHGDACLLHTQLCSSGLDTDPLYCRYLISCYAESGKMNDAQRIFDKLVQPCEWSWNELLAGYIKCDMPEHVLILYARIKEGGCKYSAGNDFVSLFKACSMLKDLQRGLEIYAEVVRTGILGGNLFLHSALIDMHSKCGDLAKAQEIFDDFSIRNVVLWTSLIAGYVEFGDFVHAFKCLEQMKVEGVFPNVITFSYYLKACANSNFLNRVKLVHAEIEVLGYQEKNKVGKSLIHTYAKCNLLAQAQTFFDRLPIRGVESWTALIAGYTDNGYGEQAIECYQCMQLEGIPPNPHTIVSILKACSSVGAINDGQMLHGDIEKRGLLNTNHFIGGALIDMYVKCRLFDQALHVFNESNIQNIVLWNTLLAGYVDNGYGEEALQYFECILHNGITMNIITFHCALRACTITENVVKGEEIHAEIVRLGLLDRTLVIGNALVDMYAKFGLLHKAHEIFDILPDKDVITWTVLLKGYADQGLSREVQNCFQQMQLEGITPNAITFSCSLKAVEMNNAMKEIQALIGSSGMHTEDSFLGAMLMNAYTKMGCLKIAREMFDKLSTRNVVSWGMILAGYVEYGDNEEAFQCYKQMQTEGTFPDAIATISILKACSSIGCVGKGHEIHVGIQQWGLSERDLAVDCALVHMYAKCGSMTMAERVFNDLPVQDTASWNALIAGYTKHGRNSMALGCINDMRRKGVSADVVTFVSCFNACGRERDFHKAQEVDAESRNMSEIETDTILCNSLINMYRKCGSLVVAQYVFDRLIVRDVISWTSLIAGYVECENFVEAAQCFELMQLEGISPNPVTYVIVLRAYRHVKDRENLHKLLKEVEKQGLLKTDMFIGSAMVDVYAKHGMLTMAHEIFEKLSTRDVISWTALLAGYTEHGDIYGALKCLQQMEVEGVSFDVVTFICSLKLCSIGEATHKGKQLHSEIMRQELLKGNPFIGNCLVAMYARSGLYVESFKVLNSLPVQTVAAWTSLIAGYAINGQGEEALKFFEQMQLHCVSPNIITFVSSLRACTTAGLTNKGRELHGDIERRGYCDSDLVLGNTLINMYAKCGLLTKAQEAFDDLQARNVVSWTALMAGYSQLGLNGRVFHLFDKMLGDGINPSPITFVVVLNACSRAGLLNESKTYFEKMNKDYGMTPTIEHHGCMIDLLGRVGQLDKASTMIEKMPFQPNDVTWFSLLIACKNSGNTVIGKQVFECALDALPWDHGCDCTLECG